MQIKVSMQEDSLAKVEVIDPSDGAVAHKAVVGRGEQYTVVAVTADSPADIEVYGPEPYVDGAVETPEREPVEAGDGGNGNTVSGSGDGSAPAGDGDTGQGDGTGAGDEQPTTSAASALPLYRVLADPIPEGFRPSGLAAPTEGGNVVLFHYEGDEAGESHTFDVGDGDEVALYAEADDDEQPVVLAEDVSDGDGEQQPA